MRPRRALLTPDLRLGEVFDPAPRPGQAIVAVHATSVNRGEARRVGRAQTAPGPTRWASSDLDQRRPSCAG